MVHSSFSIRACQSISALVSSEELLEIVRDVIEDKLLDAAAGMVVGELSNVVTDTVDKGLLEVMTGMVAGAMASSILVA